MTRDFHLKLKTLEGGSFTGIAAAYGNEDLVGDVLAPGAFKQSIQQQGNGFPLLFAHDQGQPLGVGKICDSAAGLLIDGQLVMADPNAQRVHAHLKAGSIKGLSIGYQVPPGKSVEQADGSRLLREIRLFEVSLVAVPANPLAVVTGVKSAQAVLASLRSGNLAPEDRATLVRTIQQLLGKDAMCICDCPECLAGDCAACSNADCTDSNCEGGQVHAAETLSALRSLAAELRA